MQKWPARDSASRHLPQREEAFRIVPLAQFLTERFALVDHEVAVGVLGDRVALQRARRWALEVDAGDVVPRAVTRALELLLALEPRGDAAEVRAGRAQRDQLFLRRREVHQPDADRLELLVYAGVRVLVGLADADLLFRFLERLGAEEILEHRAEG